MRAAIMTRDIKLRRFVAMGYGAVLGVIASMRACAWRIERASMWRNLADAVCW